MSETPSFRKGIFTIDGFERSIEGFTDGDTWNGWATPCFSREAAEIVVEQTHRYQMLTDPDARIALRYDQAQDAFVETSPDYDGEEIYYRGTNVEVDGQIVRVYPIGTCYWTWEEVTSWK